MAINSIGSSPNINDVVQDPNNGKPTLAQPATNDVVLDKPGSLPQDGNLLASLIQSTLNNNTLINSSTSSATANATATSTSSTTATSTSNTTTSTISPALSPRASFQNVVTNNILGAFFKISPNQILPAQGSFAVNSANQLQSSQISFTNGGTITNF
ncbi:MAG: hypothetical protein FD167_5265, partial [bacterium]